MATHTTYYNLTKPSTNDKVNIGILNDNADIIDTALHNKVNNDDTQNITTSANKCMLSDGVTSVESALDELSDKFVMETYTLSYESATNLRVTNITPPTGCSLERMIILPPNYDSVTVKVVNIFRISTLGIIALGSGFATTDTISLSVLFFKN